MKRSARWRLYDIKSVVWFVRKEYKLGRWRIVHGGVAAGEF
jgi:hypothetical protein